MSPARRGIAQWTVQALLCLCLPALPAAAQPSANRLIPSPTRQTPADLELTGQIPNLPPNRIAFLTPVQLASLPQITVLVQNDPNFPHPVHVTGVPLEALARALAVPPAADLIDALCADRYRAHYPNAYLSQHHPLLGLKIDGLSPKAWAARTHEYDPSPFFITHARFTPAFRIFAHDDEAQVPSNVIRLNFTTAAATFTPLAPPATAPQVVQQGFTIARQNCLRCHFLGTSGGTKSGRDWRMLATWAREQPAFFTAYVRNPQSRDPQSHMPGNPAYDDATLAVLSAYFRAFPLDPAPAQPKKDLR